MSSPRGPRGTALAAACLAAAAAHAQAPGVLAVAFDSPRWELEGNAKRTSVQGRDCLMLDGAAALVKGFELRDGVVDVDVVTSARRGFFGLQFRVADDGANSEWVYLRQHKSGLPDAMQYTPVLNTGLNWQLFSGPGFTAAVDIPRDEWFHLRLEVIGAQAKLFVKDMAWPALVMDDLKSGIQRGQLGLAALTGETCFANFQSARRPMPRGSATRRRRRRERSSAGASRRRSTRSHATSSARSRRPRSCRSAGRTSTPSRRGSSSSTATARARIRASRSPPTGRSGSSRSPA
ncbi:MAG TPA: hypothetical protein VGI48_17175 [Caldimonas sp.]